MEVIDAMMQRKSIRSFTPQPVPKETLVKMLEAATRAPSSSNMQEWEIYVAGGKVIENIRQTYVDRAAKNIARKSEMPRAERDKMPSVILERTNDMRAKRAQIEGLDTAAGGSINSERGVKFFGAPIIIVLCMNRVFSLYSTYDLGLLTENICLAAENFGMGTIIAAGIVSHSDVLRQELGIPDDQVIVVGIALGYPDKQAAINKYVSPRRPLNEAVTFKGI